MLAGGTLSGLACLRSCWEFSFCGKDSALLVHSGVFHHERSNGLYLLGYIQKHWIMAEVYFLFLAETLSQLC